MTQHKEDNQGIRPRQHVFRKGRSSLTDLIFNNEVTCLVHEEKTVDVAYVDFSKAFDTVSYSTLLEELVVHSLDRCTIHWVKNWMDGQTQRGVACDLKYKVYLFCISQENRTCKSDYTLI